MRRAQPPTLDDVRLITSRDPATLIGMKPDPGFVLFVVIFLIALPIVSILMTGSG